MDSFSERRLVIRPISIPLSFNFQDLSALNRDLSKVIMIDCDEKAPRDNLRNAIILNKWEGDPTDRRLFDLIPFLLSEYPSFSSKNSEVKEKL